MQRFARKICKIGHSNLRKVIANEVNVMTSLQKPKFHEHIIEILGHGSLGQKTASYIIDMEYCDFDLDQYIYKDASIHALMSYKMAKDEGQTLLLHLCHSAASSQRSNIHPQPGPSSSRLKAQKQ